MHRIQRLSVRAAAARLSSAAGLLAACCVCLALLGPAGARAATAATAPTQTTTNVAAGGGSSLEAIASKAGDTGRKVAMSLIGLALALAGIVLAFRRDFKQAAGIFAVGIVAVLLATPSGLSLLQNTVNSLVA
ncbi:MAG TPA: hypothetical protein VMS02_01065 [Solirubrobacteraceae bacterium]|nr:hypothetical protein [Solirubrobacteraceae bacterium]